MQTVAGENFGDSNEFAKVLKHKKCEKVMGQGCRKVIITGHVKLNYLWVLFNLMHGHPITLQLFFLYSSAALCFISLPDLEITMPVLYWRRNQSGWSSFGWTTFQGKSKISFCKKQVPYFTGWHVISHDYYKFQVKMVRQLTKIFILKLCIKQPCTTWWPS